jgi:hypothetical protein
MAQAMKSHKSGATPRWARELIEREDEIEACARVLFGPSHAKYRDQIKKVFAYAFKRGRTAGWRVAKGLKTPTKKPGRPSEIDARALLIHVVETRKPDQTIKEAVIDFLCNMEVGRRVDRWLGENNLADPSDASSLPDHVMRVAISPAAVNKALWAYYRHRPRNRPS